MKNNNIYHSSYINITDNKLIHFNFGRRDNEEKSLIYKDSNGIFRLIVFDVCANNYQKYNPNSNGNCIAEINVQDFSFTFYTSGILTRVMFKNKYYSNFSYNKLLSGSRINRFEKLRKMIEETGYTCQDNLSICT